MCHNLCQSVFKFDTPFSARSHVGQFGFFFKLLIDSLWISHHAIPLISRSLCICHLPLQSPLLKENKDDRIKKEKSFMEAIVCHYIYPTIYPFVHTSLLANVHCNQSLLSFEASGFCYSINTGSSPGLLLDTLLFSVVIEIPQLWIFRTSLLPAPAIHRWGRCLGGTTRSPGSGPW